MGKVYIVELTSLVISAPINAPIKAFLDEKEAQEFSHKINKAILSNEGVRTIDYSDWMWLRINIDTEEVVISPYKGKDPDWDVQYTIGRYTHAIVEEVASAF